MYKKVFSNPRLEDLDFLLKVFSFESQLLGLGLWSILSYFSYRVEGPNFILFWS